MTQNNVARWVPSIGLAERPADIFDLNWQGGDQRLLVTLRYANNAGEAEMEAIIIFHNVFAHQVFDEDMDDVGLLERPAVKLAVAYPYGGRWPFLEVKASSWIDLLVKRHSGWFAEDFRHLIVTSRNMHLHVACQKSLKPTYVSC